MVQYMQFYSPNFRTLYFHKYLHSILFTFFDFSSIYRRILLFHCTRCPYLHTLFIKSKYTVNTIVVGDVLLYPHTWSTILPINGDIFSMFFISFASNTPNNLSSRGEIQTRTSIVGFNISFNFWKFACIPTRLINRFKSFNIAVRTLSNCLILRSPLPIQSVYFLLLLRRL